MKAIGLTGGIGSGKTTVSDYLRDKGIKVIDADRIAREVTEDPDMIRRLAEAFGSDVLDGPAALDRKKLAEKAFASSSGKEKLDSMTHRNIFAIISQRLAEYAKGSENIVFIDAPLLFETGLDAIVQETWVVTADESLRMNRVFHRDGTGERVFLDISGKQMNEKEKIKRADRILDNSGSKEKLYTQIERLLAENDWQDTENIR